MLEKTKEYWVKKLDLLHHPEGGFYKQTFKSENMVTIPGKVETPHSACTDIYYLMGSLVIGDFSAWHRLNNLEETWHHHYGNDVIIYIIDSAGNLTENHLGYADKAQLQIHVPASSWFCAHVNSENPDDYALVSCTVHPGFDFNDFELANRESLSNEFPEYKNIIEKFTRIEINQEKKIESSLVDKLSPEEILQISLKNLHSFNSTKSSTTSGVFLQEADSPEQTLKKILKDISEKKLEDSKIKSMIEAIEKSDIDLDIFSKIRTQLKEENYRKAVNDNSVTFKNI
jgi:predicted cupin superfamily sugar epimerase